MAGALREETFDAEVMPLEDVLLVAGQELVRPDSKLAQSAVEQAEANLRQTELSDAATRLDLDEDTLAIRRRNHERAQELPGPHCAGERGDGSVEDAVAAHNDSRAV